MTVCLKTKYSDSLLHQSVSKEREPSGDTGWQHKSVKPRTDALRQPFLFRKLIFQSGITNKIYLGLKSQSEMNFVGENIAALYSWPRARNETVTRYIFKNEIPSSSTAGQPQNYARPPLTLPEVKEIICRQVTSVIPYCVRSDCVLFVLCFSES